jgi:hypothetical protein
MYPIGHFSIMNSNYIDLKEIIVTDGLIKTLEESFPASRLQNTDMTLDDLRVIQGQQSVIVWLKNKQRQLNLTKG